MGAPLAGLRATRTAGTWNAPRPRERYVFVLLSLSSLPSPSACLASFTQPATFPADKRVSYLPLQALESHLNGYKVGIGRRYKAAKQSSIDNIDTLEDRRADWFEQAVGAHPVSHDFKINESRMPRCM